MPVRSRPWAKTFRAFISDAAHGCDRSSREDLPVRASRALYKPSAFTSPVPRCPAWPALPWFPAPPAPRVLLPPHPTSHPCAVPLLLSRPFALPVSASRPLRRSASRSSFRALRRRHFLARPFPSSAALASRLVLPALGFAPFASRAVLFRWPGFASRIPGDALLPPLPFAPFTSGGSSSGRTSSRSTSVSVIHNLWDVIESALDHA